jgi:hypothetical protein
MIGQVSIAAATAVVGYDLFQNTTWQISSRPRVISGIACAGSTAINDSAFELFVENVKVGNFYNTRAGVIAPLADDVIALGKTYVPAGSKISAIVTDAPATNALNVIVY